VPDNIGRCLVLPYGKILEVNLGIKISVFLTDHCISINDLDI
jgi:hypothetical protein